MRHQEAVGGAEQGRGVLDDGVRGVAEAEADAGRLLVHDTGERGAEDGDRVVGGEEPEFAAFGGGVEVGLAAEEPFQQVAGGGGAVEQNLPEGGELVVATDAGEQIVVEVGRSRASEALIAGWLRPSRCPARVTLRSSSRARSATTRLRSRLARFTGAFLRVVRCPAGPALPGGFGAFPGGPVVPAVRRRPWQQGESNGSFCGTFTRDRPLAE